MSIWEERRRQRQEEEVWQELQEREKKFKRRNLTDKLMSVKNKTQVMTVLSRKVMT
jgi:hypothetical protein